MSQNLSNELNHTVLRSERLIRGSACYKVSCDAISEIMIHSIEIQQQNKNNAFTAASSRGGSSVAASGSRQATGNTVTTIATLKINEQFIITKAE